jgi:hypothetical protein
MAVTIAEICTDTETALSGITTTNGLTILAHNYNEIKEGMPDYPLLEVYPEDLEVDSRTETDATTLSKAVRVHSLTIHVDVYVHTRNQIDENMEDVVDCWDAVEDRLEDGSAGGAGCPIFGNEFIRNIHWTAERVTFDRQSLLYSGIRFILVLEVF